ncbi:hypothetical protein FOXB_02008 [Fusarium oxysporum f. sp. conglutinans Fo5176]|uniref:Uncharacterized protein n=1 Tax=Fusarium oxysporum (strain Fo5176) TaxID=660025 RepID=F9F6I3_FUSOF|nr:hypothetical protein FOXB_02008 [Fusarium oxysporum f. sp. conglutinans Fo5176]
MTLERRRTRMSKTEADPTNKAPRCCSLQNAPEH